MSNCQWAVMCKADQTITGPFNSPESAERFIEDDARPAGARAGDYRVMPFYQIDEEWEEGEGDED